MLFSDGHTYTINIHTRDTHRYEKYLGTVYLHSSLNQMRVIRRAPHGTHINNRSLHVGSSYVLACLMPTPGPRVCAGEDRMVAERVLVIDRGARHGNGAQWL